jgi:EAL domain-containing protein (putative c-di-GMP-specific phosphodiesterase class I)
VDDFGTGYSSLRCLRKFPISALKIDQSFVRQITRAPDETTILAAVIRLGRSLKLRVIAEGVEKHTKSWHFFKRASVMRRKDTIPAGQFRPCSSRSSSRQE